MTSTGRLTLTERLKIETYNDHEALEQLPITSLLARGELSQQGYVEILKQLFLIHDRLEGLLEKHFNDPKISAVYKPDYHPRRNRALSDIHHFEPELRAQQIKPNAGTRKLLDLFDAIAKQTPALLLGAFYVIEGSNFGATFLVKIFQKTYGLEEAGVSYYLGHKHELKPRWELFKTTLNAHFPNMDEQNHLVEIAKETFQLIGEVYENIDIGDQGEPVIKKAVAH